MTRRVWWVPLPPARLTPQASRSILGPCISSSHSLPVSVPSTRRHVTLNNIRPHQWVCVLPSFATRTSLSNLLAHSSQTQRL